MTLTKSLLFTTEFSKGWSEGWEDATQATLDYLQEKYPNLDIDYTEYVEKMK